MLVFYDARYVEAIIKKKIKKCKQFHSLPFSNIVFYTIFKEILGDQLRKYDESTLHIIFLHNSFDKNTSKNILYLFNGVKDFIHNNVFESNRIFLIKPKDEQEDRMATTRDSMNINWEIHTLGTNLPTSVPLESFVYESKKSNIIDCACFFNETGEITIVTNDKDTVYNSIISSRGQFTVVNACNDVTINTAQSRE